MITNKDTTKRYVALLSQNGTSAPVATVLLNTFGVDITWSRLGVGTYSGALGFPEIFPLDHTTVVHGGEGTVSITSGIAVGAWISSENTIAIQSATFESLGDDLLGRLTIEITVYNQYD